MCDGVGDESGHRHGPAGWPTGAKNVVAKKLCWIVRTLLDQGFKLRQIIQQEWPRQTGEIRGHSQDQDSRKNCQRNGPEALNITAERNCVCQICH